MKKSYLILVVMIGFIAAPLAAQVPTPPKPLESPMMKWMVGEWEGTFESPMGKSQEWMACSMGLNDQFLLMEGASTVQAGKYKGMGALTIDPKTGGTHGYWIDNFRGRYEGKGKEEGNKIIMEWTGTMGTSTRTIEKVNEDKMKVSVTMPGPDGKPATYTGELTRKKK